MAYEDLLVSTCVVQEKTSTQNNTGSHSESWADKLTGEKTRRFKNKEPKIFDDLAQTYIDNYKFYFLTGTNIVVANRIVFDGENYEVLSVDNDSSGTHHMKVYAKITKQ